MIVAEEVIGLQVRAAVQRALGRPLPLEEIGTMTIGDLKALTAGAGGDKKAAAKQPAKAKAAPEQPAKKPEPLSVDPATEMAGPPTPEQVGAHLQDPHRNIQKHSSPMIHFPIAGDICMLREDARVQSSLPDDFHAPTRAA